MLLLPRPRLGQILLLALLLAIPTAGCGRAAKNVNTPDTLSEMSADSNSASVAVDTPPDALAPSSIAENPPVPAATTQQNSASTLESLTQSVRKYTVEQHHLPKTLDEVIRAGYISRLPDAPGGKKFALDLKTVRVVLVDR
jgi:hypothetical protein